jgi:hypothetical protein
MNKKIKIFIASLIGLISIVFGLLFFGLYLMDEEDRYGDLVYFKNYVKDGDIIFRKSLSKKSKADNEFNEFGIIEKSWNKVYVWDSQNTVKQNLYDWSEKSKNRNVKVYRSKNLNFKNTLSNNYKELIDTNNLEFIIEN